MARTVLDRSDAVRALAGVFRKRGFDGGSLSVVQRETGIGRGSLHHFFPDDLWWSGKHHRHGGNLQVLTAPASWPIWVSPVRPGREHDTTCVRAHANLLSTLEDFTAAGHEVLADLGYEGGRIGSPAHARSREAAS